jgi:spermidine synthase
VFMASGIGASSLDVGVVGLGVGSLVAYGGRDDVFTFYEIDPVVEELAQDPDYFTLLREATSDVDVVIGDGRLLLEQRRPVHDLLVVDAFSSDAIPVHLLTVEAVSTYLDSLSGGGRLLLHTSNRHLDLEPVVGRIARELGVAARVRSYVPAGGDTLAAPSTWIVIEPSQAEKLDLGQEWEPAEVGDAVWTDDYSNILSVMVWG